MAKITIELDTTTNPDDIALLHAVSSALSPHVGPSVTYTVSEDEERPTIAAEAPRRGRKPKTSEVGSAPAAEPSPTQEIQQTAGSSLAAPPAGEPGITLAQINDRIRELLSRQADIGQKLLDTVHKATEGTSSSPKHCDPKYWPAIWSALEAF